MIGVFNHVLMVCVQFKTAFSVRFAQVSSRYVDFLFLPDFSLIALIISVQKYKKLHIFMPGGSM